MLPDGTTLHDMSKIIGLPNGCHDGFWDENLHFVRPTSDIGIAYWVTADGMIFAELPGGIEDSTCTVPTVSRGAQLLILWHAK